MKQGSTGLTLREQSADFKSLFEFNPKNINQWLQNLPIANLADSSRAVYRVLVDMNQSQLPPDKRLEYINLLEPTAQKLAVALEKLFINNHIVLTDKQKKVAALIQAIQTELSICYHSIVESLHQSDLNKNQSEIMTSALVMAMKYHGLVMLRCFQLYTSIPGRLWREVYILFQIASAKGIEKEFATISQAGLKRSTTQYFMRVLLLGIANPYQLRQYDIQMLWELLPTLVDHANLSSHAYNKHHFVVTLNSSSPPAHKTLNQNELSDKVLKLTVGAVVDELKSQLATTNNSGHQGLRKNMLLRHLIQCWSQGTHRAFARTPCAESIDISIGLAATHYLLEQSQRQATQNTESQAEEPTTLETMEGSLRNATLTEVVSRKDDFSQSTGSFLTSTEVPSQDVWEKLYRSNQVVINEEPGTTDVRSKDSIVKDNYRLQKVKLVNMSPGGYCLQLHSDDLPKHAQTGEVLGFLEKSQTTRESWSVGVVRWVRRQAKGDSVQMGVQLLAPSILPIEVQHRLSKNTQADYQRGLMLPALTGVGQPATLLTNPLSFSVNSKLKVVEQGHEYEVRLSKEICSTTSFKQFQFDRMESAKRIEPKADLNKLSSFDPSDLDGIWDLI